MSALRGRSGARTGGARTRARQHARGRAEVALALVLLVGAALFVRSFLNLQRADTGFDPAPLTTVRIFMPGQDATGRRREGATRRQTCCERAASDCPGCRRPAASNLIPLDGGGDEQPGRRRGCAARAGREPRLFFAGVTARLLRRRSACRRSVAVPSPPPRAETRSAVADGQRQHRPPLLRAARRRPGCRRWRQRRLLGARELGEIDRWAGASG